MKQKSSTSYKPSTSEVRSLLLRTGFTQLTLSVTEDGTIQKSSEICFLPAIDCLIYDIIANVVTQIGPFGLIKANLSE